MDGLPNGQFGLFTWWQSMLVYVVTTWCWLNKNLKLFYMITKREFELTSSDALASPVSATTITRSAVHSSRFVSFYVIHKEALSFAFSAYSKFIHWELTLSATLLALWLAVITAGSSVITPLKSHLKKLYSSNCVSVYILVLESSFRCPLKSHLRNCKVPTSKYQKLGRALS